MDKEYSIDDLTKEELKILKALLRLEILWKKHGQRLTLFNGDSLRINGVGAQHEIYSFPYIKGEGGDGGDFF